MLAEIYCDKFISNDHIREPIKFHLGLNVIEGEDNGKNSIGKSTFLMCIDFAFGGNDYIDKLKTIKSNVGDHTIFFTFKFKNEFLSFARETSSPKIVYKCDENRNKLEPWSLNEYTAFLKMKYGIHNQEASFRDLVSRYFRIYNRGNIDETLPLRGFSNESPTDSVRALFKVFNLYEKVKKSEDAYNLSSDKKKSLKSAGEYSFVPAISTDKYNENKLKIEELSTKAHDLFEKSKTGAIEIDSQKTEALLDLDAKLKVLKRERSLNYNKIDSIKKDKELSGIDIQADFIELQSFFPNVNIAKLSEIETFHKGLSKILKKEIDDLESKTWSVIKLLNIQIDELEAKKLEIGGSNKISSVVLKQYKDICLELERLQKENEYYDKMISLKADEKKDKEVLEETYVDEGKILSTKINEKMHELNSIIFPNYEDPVLQIKKTGNYEFSTQNDEGTGTNFKGLILFDLSVLSLTDVPALAHDSVTIKNVDDDITANIYKTYISFKNKQIFTVIDKVTSNENTLLKTIVDEHRVLHLSSGGNELFGRSWAKKVIQKEEE